MQNNYEYSQKGSRAIQKEPLARNWTDKGIWGLTTFLFASFFMQNTNVYGGLVLVGISAVILLLLLIKSKWKVPIMVRHYHIHVLMFALFCYLSAVWALEPKAALDDGTTILSIFICTYVLYWAFDQANGVKRLLDACMIGGYVVAVYTFMMHGVGNIIDLLGSGTRLGAEFANSNSVGMVMAICLTISVFDALNYGIKWRHIGVVPAALVLAVTGSRTALIEAAAGIILVVLFKNIRSGKLSVTKILRTVITMAIVVVALVYISRLPVFAGLMKRMARLLADFTGEGTVDNSTQLRQEFIQIGIRQFKETPIFGIGMGSSYVLTKMYTGHSTYLHNNFVEMLASGGILGFVVFYSMHAYVLYQLWKKRHKNDPLTDVCLTLLLIYILADYGTVSYYTKETYFLFMICFLQAETNRGETNEPKKNIPGRMEVSYKA